MTQKSRKPATYQKFKTECDGGQLTVEGGFINGRDSGGIGVYIEAPTTNGKGTHRIYVEVTPAEAKALAAILLSEAEEVEFKVTTGKWKHESLGEQNEHENR